MQSPFPGMDPYIEACQLWDDFHHDLLLEIKGALAAQLPAGYVVRGSERTYLVMGPAEGQRQEHRFWSDVSVASTGTAAAGTATVSPAVPASASEVNPVSIPALVETEYREIFLEIRRPPPEKKLVTCIEVLSPSNKHSRSKGWRLFNRKRRAYLAGQAHYVEIDLLRGGRRMPMAGTWPDSPYYLLVCRKNEAPLCKVWRAFFTRPVTPIPIPLLPPDADVTLEIQPLIQKIYARSHYEVDIDYGQSLNPPLSAADAVWLQERLQEQSRSPAD
ncbi:MAG TPA: DUF4058 family protein [Gemmataceae bacterium]|jgi:hypothetical protein|nr:DUF4058 family protein [Gemmataceae bacterium]